MRRMEITDASGSCSAQLVPQLSASRQRMPSTFRDAMILDHGLTVSHQKKRAEAKPGG